MNIHTAKESFNSEGYTLLTKDYKNQSQKLDYICTNGHKRKTTWKNWKRGRRCLICKNQRTKPSIETIKESFEKEGYIFLSKEYINNKTKLDYSCPNKHKNSITWGDWNTAGHRCPDCANNKRLSIEQVVADFNSEEYIFVFGEYLNNNSVLIVRCPKGHEFETSRVRWTSGNRCPACHEERVSIDLIRESFVEAGYELLSKEYVNAHTKLDYICPNDHKHNISWAAWQQGERCYYCRNDNNRVSIEDTKILFLAEGYTFIESSYRDEKFRYICPNAHEGEITLGNWKSGNRCPHCHGNAKLKFEYVKEEIETEGYIVVTVKEDYENNRTKLHLICPNGHSYYVSWFDWNTNKVRCYKCKEKGTSLQEQEIIEYIKSWGVDIEVHDRYLIRPYELDILIPSKKIAIEYCGLYWHSELRNKSKNYHLSKLKKCNHEGYDLITIFEDEWTNKKEIVLSRLKNILGIEENVETLYAEWLNIKEVDALTTRKFCKENHLQGYVYSNINLGAFYKDKLVSIMTFSRPKEQSDYSLGVWELSRFCSKLNYKVVDAAYKLLLYFKNNYRWKQVFSYSDRRWFTGKIFEQMGFKFDGNTKPNYWYLVSGDVERYHQSSLNKGLEKPKNTIGRGLRKAEGYNRIWDCGNLKYVMYNNK